MGKRPSLLKAPKSRIGLERKNTKKFYQTKEWKQLRKEMKELKRKEHEAIVMDIYKSNPENKRDDLMEFLESDMPMCEINMKKNLIKLASVLDHIKPIRQGGAKMAKRNLQWVTTEEHNSKSGKEGHE